MSEKVLILNGSRYGVDVRWQAEKEESGIVFDNVNSKRNEFNEATITIANNDPNAKYKVGDVVVLDSAALIELNVQDETLFIVREVDILMGLGQSYE